VITPDDPGYDQAHSVFYGAIDHHPAMIVRPIDATEVAQVVTLARGSGLPLAVRSGGHSLAGYGACEGDHSEVCVMPCALGR
jgi:FAD/FMN-containing dehydrogenase